MPRFFAALILCLSTAAFASAEDIGAGRTGQDLVQYIRSHYRPTKTLSYHDARAKMFSDIDNRNGKVRCVYTGVEVSTNGIPPATVMNTEHTWPQSKFRSHLPMKSDLFHLFPTLSGANSDRANNPFGDIPDDQTEHWWRSGHPQTSRPHSDIDEFSESVDDRFEPREDHKGNVARAMLYFWTVYGADDITPHFINGQLSTLLDWHDADPVDATERQRESRISAIQGNRNPFVLDSTLARRVVARSDTEAPASIARAAAARLSESQPISIRLAGWNMQSTMNPNRPESDPDYLATLMAQKKGINLWGLCEVRDVESLRAFERGAEDGEEADFVSIMGTTGGTDRLAVLYDRALFEPVGHPIELRTETQLSHGLRASLVVRFKGRRTGQEFLFVVNHLKRGGEQNATRLQQAKNLNAWARNQQLPIVAVGDWNFDYDPQLGDMGLPHRDGGFDALCNDRIFQWIKPHRLLKTQSSDEYNSILDFIFVANAPFGWTGESRILDQEGDQPATEEDFEDDERTTDHRPVDAILVLNPTIPRLPVRASGAANVPRAPTVPHVAIPRATASPAPAEARATASDKLLIGAWNIEHCGRPGDTTDPLHIAEYIMASQVAILGLEEIYDTDGNAQTRTNSKLDAAFQHIAEKTQQHWEYRLFPKSTHENESEQTKQLTGIAWNASKVQLSGEPFLIPVAHGGARPDDFWRRQPHAVKFTTGTSTTDLVLIPVHMRSNSHGHGQTVTAPELRRGEAESLLSRLDAIREHFHDEDIVILGDTNVLSRTETAVSKFTQGGFRDLNAADMKTWMNNGVRKSPFDRFFVPDDQSEFDHSAQEAVLTLPAGLSQSEFDHQVSDHLMIRTTVVVTQDDD